MERWELVGFVLVQEEALRVVLAEPELPVVAPDTGGVLSYADDTTAWLAKPTGAAFAAAVRAVIEQPVRAAMRTCVALERAATFHEDLVVPRFFSLLDTLHAQRLQAQAAATPDFIAGTLTGSSATSRKAR